MALVPEIRGANNPGIREYLRVPPNCASSAVRKCCPLSPGIQIARSILVLCSSVTRRTVGEPFRARDVILLDQFFPQRDLVFRLLVIHVEYFFFRVDVLF